VRFLGFLVDKDNYFISLASGKLVQEKYGKSNRNSRFPSGMTGKKSKGRGNSRLSSRMTDRKATATATTKATTKARVFLYCALLGGNSVQFAAGFVCPTLSAERMGHPDLLLWMRTHILVTEVQKRDAGHPRLLRFGRF
jgi:hypothetical protein